MDIQDRQDKKSLVIQFLFNYPEKSCTSMSNLVFFVCDSEFAANLI